MISVVLCTRNRANHLRRALESIGNLSRPCDLAWEVVVIDNDSTDDTRAVSELFLRESGINVTYVFEGRRGTSHARNAGIRAAQGDVLAFVDDDIIVDPEWLVNIVSECIGDGTCSVLFGQTKLMWADQARIAIKEEPFEEIYVYPCNPAAPGASNNMVVRRSILERVVGFDTSLGPGTLLRGAEDTDFTYRVLRSGGKIKYCPRILVRHNHDRLTRKAVQSLLLSYGRARGGFYCKYVLRRDRWAAKLCYWEIECCLKRLLDQDRRRDTAVHLIGMAAGFVLRLGLEVTALVRRRPIGCGMDTAACCS